MTDTLPPLGSPVDPSFGHDGFEEKTDPGRDGEYRVRVASDASTPSKKTTLVQSEPGFHFFKTWRKAQYRSANRFQKVLLKVKGAFDWLARIVTTVGTVWKFWHVVEPYAAKVFHHGR